jgi:8-oxo-dGTP diphosphatase
MAGWGFQAQGADSGAAAALERELRDSLGSMSGPITFATHEEPGLRILLLFYEAAIRSGDPHPREGQEVAWVPPAELRRYPTPPADAALVERLAAAPMP